jgi:hypothetical protein
MIKHHIKKNTYCQIGSTILCLLEIHFKYKEQHFRDGERYNIFNTDQKKARIASLITQ